MTLLETAQWLGIRWPLGPLAAGNGTLSFF